MEEELIKKYKLSTKEHLVILDKLKRDIFASQTISSKPSLIFVIGQPGSGKTTYINNTDFKEYLIINSDDYRKYSRYSEEILEKYPTQYAKLTNYDAHLWGDELFAYGKKHNYSLLREKAPLDESLYDTLRHIPKNYDIIIDVLVTGNLASLLATRERYERMILIDKQAKLSNIDSHNLCYDILPNLIGKFISLGIKVNYIISHEDTYQVIPVNENYLETLNRLRKENNDNTLKTYAKRIKAIKDSMHKRNAPKEEFDELARIEDIYRKLERSQK